jgi:hypothetical protein
MEPTGEKMNMEKKKVFIGVKSIRRCVTNAKYARKFVQWMRLRSHRIPSLDMTVFFVSVV